jgi:hypothetical protein
MLGRRDLTSRRDLRDRRGARAVSFAVLPANTTIVERMHPHLHEAIDRFIGWLDSYGETSFDHQSYYAGPVGRRAKALYYRRRVGTLAVAPMVLSEALLPSGRRLFWKKQRFPIADAHYAIGFARLARATGDAAHLRRASHFADVLETTRAPAYERHAWGYPFDWVTRTGVMKADTPLITSTPYVFEAFLAVDELEPSPGRRAVLASIAEHAFRDFPVRVHAPGIESAGYNPHDRVGGVINAAAYRAFLLTRAGLLFGRGEYLEAARRNVAFVLSEQRPDGSWFYAADGVRDFVDHFHTCFVLKSLAKIDALVPDADVARAIDAGVAFYVRELFDDAGLPRPFARAPRLTVYRHELYDYAECLNLGLLLGDRHPALAERVDATLDDLLRRWRKPDGSFRSRRLLLGWDDVPMHRWAQSQAFCARTGHLVRVRSGGGHAAQALARPTLAPARSTGTSG